jgi:hypothetical protein
LLAVFVIGILAVSPLGMGLLRLTKILHQGIALVATVRVLFFLAGAICALHVFCHSTGTRREVPFAFPLALCFPLTFLFLLLLLDQRDVHATEQEKDKEISAINDATGFRHCLLHKDLPTGLINLSLLYPQICVRET